MASRSFKNIVDNWLNNVEVKKRNNTDIFSKCDELIQFFGEKNRGKTKSIMKELLLEIPYLNNSIKILFEKIIKMNDYYKIAKEVTLFFSGHGRGYNQNYLHIFIDKDQLIEFNSHMNTQYSNILKKINPQVIGLVKDDRPLLEHFVREELYKDNSDYYMGEYKSGDFIGYPTRVYYGLYLQWDQVNDWEEHLGKEIKITTKPNKTKFEFFINPKKPKNKNLLKDLADRMETKLKTLIDTIKDIVNVDKYDDDKLDEIDKYILRAFYLYKYIITSGGKSSIVTNQRGNKFLKKQKKGNPEKEGTFLSIIYDTYNEAIKKEKRRGKKRVSKSPLKLNNSKLSTDVVKNISKKKINKKSGM
jgi:hypothetical protein